jgi:alpha,alpha-trehalase
MVALLEPAHPERAFARYLAQLKREHAFWMDGAAEATPARAVRRVVALAPGTLLNRYFDDSDLPRDESFREDQLLAKSSGREPRQFFRDVRAAAESGWDFSSRWFGDGHTLTSIETTSIVPVDLNSLLYGLEQAIASACEARADRACAQEFNARAAARRAAMDRFLWDAALGAYLDYNSARRERVQRLSAATLYPLFTHAASAAQAAGVARNTRARLLKGGGIVTTTATTGQQWDAPNGWAPLQWLAVDGLSHYQQRPLAAQIACRWIVNVARNYRASGKLVEKYDVVNTAREGGGGEYPLQDGFGWTNGVTRKLLALYPAASEYRSVEQCRPHKAGARGAH